MLERYFFKPETVDRMRAFWLGESIERYVAYLDQHGYAARTIYRRVPLIVKFGEFAQRQGAKNLEELPTHAAAFVEDYFKTRPFSRKNARRQSVKREIRGPVLQFLRAVLSGYTEGLRRSPQLEFPFLNQAPGFFSYLREERGVKESRIYQYELSLRDLEEYLSRIGKPRLSALRPNIVTQFVVDYVDAQANRRSRKRPGNSTMIRLCCCVRVFLRYLHREGIISRDLGAVVESPRQYRLADIPRYISWEEVRQVLDAVDRRSAAGRRDFAILLLLVAYGLRGHEVARLTLDDIDWKRERLHVLGRKEGHSTVYPLSTVVGEAILDYLQRDRPQTTDRHVFFLVYAPYKPLSGHTIVSLAARRLHRAGVQVVRPGSHTFRHSCVQRLVESNFPYKTIGDYVGHRSPTSTEVYTKVAVETLREVALGDVEEIL